MYTETHYNDQPLGRPDKADKVLKVVFSTDAIENKITSEWIDYPRVTIHMPGGDIHSELLKNAKRLKHFQQRFPEHWARFEAGKGEIKGMPLEEWPTIGKSRIRALQSRNILSVEQLAAISDGDLQLLGMDGRALRKKAQVYLEAKEGQAPLDRLVSEMEQLRARCDTLEAQNVELTALVPKKRNRKKEE